MKYIFVINGRQDKIWILSEIKTQIAALEAPIDYQLYVTKGHGDGTRFVRLYCQFHGEEEVCFVACGGSGMVNEVATGVIGYGKGKYVALLAFGTTNDLTKHYSGRDFKSVKSMLDYEMVTIDAIKCNDDYSINVTNIGFDSIAAHKANLYIEEGHKNGYKKGVAEALLWYRFNKFDVIVDGEKIHFTRNTLCTISNASHYGGSFYCAPDALTDDGLLNVSVMKGISLISVGRMMALYTKGEHLTNEWSRSRFHVKKGRHIVIKSKDLLYACLDGEIVASTEFVIDILDKAVTLLLPKKKSN